MSIPVPDKRYAQGIGGRSGNTWAALRSTIWPSTGLQPPKANWGDTMYAIVNIPRKHSYGYPASENQDGVPFRLLKSFPFDIDQTGYDVSHSLSVGVNFVEVPGWKPPNPNTDGLAGLWHSKLVLGIGNGSSLDFFYTRQGSQNRYKYPNNGEYGGPWIDYLLGYDYETTKKSLVGVQVSITVRFWPVPYVPKDNGDPPDPESFTAQVSMSDIMFPENQEWSIASNRIGGQIIFIGSGNYVTYASPTQQPPNPWTINWIDFTD